MGTHASRRLVFAPDQIGSFYKWQKRRFIIAQAGFAA
jgi:hypothetical protein